jgi:phosphate:Na+ symporter
MIKHGFTRAYASSLQKVIAANTSNRVKAFLAGMGVTAILQSSTATAMICASFASKRAIGTAAGISVVIGADVGTTLVAQVLTFDLSWLAPLLLLSGVAMHHQFQHKGKLKHIARACIGLGQVLLALSLIKECAAPLGDSPLLPMILKPLEDEPLLAITVTALMTWILHSSIASVLIISSFTSSGLITLKLGLLLVLGANLGAAIAPFVMTYKMDSRTRRITTGNLIMRASMVLMTLPFLGIFLLLYKDLHLNILAGREIIHFHMIFNIALAVIFLPFVVSMASFCRKIIPDKPTQTNEGIIPIYLDESALGTPTLALACAARETLRSAKIVETMFIDCMRALKEEDTTLISMIQKCDDQIDHLHTQTKFYLARVAEESLDPIESDRFIQILGFSTNLEHIGDIIENSLTGIILSKIDGQHKFSKDGFKEIRAFHESVLDNMKIAQAVFMAEDPKLAERLIEDKALIRAAAEETQKRHFQRLRKGVPESQMTSTLHIDIIRDLKSINGYLTTVAYAVLDNAKKKQTANLPKEETSDESIKMSFEIDAKGNCA